MDPPCCVAPGTKTMKLNQNENQSKKQTMASEKKQTNQKRDTLRTIFKIHSF